MQMLKNTGKTYLNSYLKIINLRKSREYTAKDKGFQEYRRGRYAEFSLKSVIFAQIFIEYYRTYGKFQIIAGGQ